MSKTSKIRQLMTLCLSMLLVITGAVFAAPAANAAEVSATVISAPGVAYVNVRNGAGLEYAKIGQIDAGEAVTLQCYQYTSGADVKGPYSSVEFGTESRNVATVGCQQHMSMLELPTPQHRLA